MTLLDVHDVTTEFSTTRGTVRAVDNVSFRISAGATLAVVGESGCGKSTTALSVIGLLPRRHARIISGQILFQGRDLVTMSDRHLEDVRGPGIGTVFQDPLASLNPSFTIGSQIVETLRRHGRGGKTEAGRRALDVLAEVRLPDPDRVYRSYPHQLSGGMRQRALIALALCCDPALLIADEPTTALDVTVQAEIVQLLARLRAERDMGMLLITHDMGLAAQAADDIAVMYAGEIVEIGPTGPVLADPAHPYTKALIGALPPLDGEEVRHARLTAIPGDPPDLSNPPGGDRFAARFATEADAVAPGLPSPDFEEVASGHFSRGGRRPAYV